MNFKDYKIEEFLEDLASESPSPGGGSVAGLVAALAGSLNSMVYSLTVNKKAFQNLSIEDQKLVLDFKEASDKFIKKSVNAMEKDRDAFNKLMDCYKMPKGNDDEIASRNKSISEKTIGAMLAPYELANDAYEFYDNIDIAVKYGNKMLLSDAVCAAILLNAAIEASIENVKINISGLSSKDYAEKITTEIDELIKKSYQRKEGICSATR